MEWRWGDSAKKVWFSDTNSEFIITDVWDVTSKQESKQPKSNYNTTSIQHTSSYNPKTPSTNTEDEEEKILHHIQNSYLNDRGERIFEL